MKLPSKKKVAIGFGVVALLLAITAIVMVWPYFRARSSIQQSKEQLRADMDEAAAEFPEIVDYDSYSKRFSPDNNGWPKVMQAYRLREQLEEDSRSSEDGDDWYARAVDPIEYESGEHDIPAMKRFLQETEEAAALFRQPLESDVIVPQDFWSDDATITIIDVLQAMKFPFLRARMLSLCGQQEQAEKEFIDALNVVAKLKCDANVVGAMMHTGVKTTADLAVVKDSDNPTALVEQAIEISLTHQVDPRGALRGELAFMSRNIRLYVETVEDDLWDAHKVWELSWGQGWTEKADEMLLATSWFRSVSRANIALEKGSVDYLDLKSIADFVDSIQQTDERLEGYDPNDLVYRVFFSPLKLALNTVKLRLMALELELGNLDKHRPEVEALVSRELPQYRVVWVGDDDNDDSEVLSDDALFVIEAKPEYAERFTHADLPQLEYGPLAE